MPAPARASLGTPTALPRRSKNWQRGALSAAVIALATAAAWGLSATSALRQLELKIHDQTVIWAGESAPPDNIVIVTMDPATEKAIPAPRILWHPQYAALMRAIGRGGAQAAAFDIFLAISVEPWAPDYDRQIAEAFSEVAMTTPFVMAFDTADGVPDHLPLYLLANTMQLTGFANFTLDADGFVRRQQLISNDGTIESLAARLAAAATGESWNAADYASGAAPALQLGERVVPVDGDRAVAISYYGPAKHFKRVSMIEVLRAAEKQDEKALRGMFEGKVVLVGTIESSDTHPTPFYRAGDSPQLTPGVEIHANVLAALLESRFLRGTPSWATLLLMLLAATAAAGIARWCGSHRNLVTSAAALVLLAAGYLLLSAQVLKTGLVLPKVPVLLALALSSGAAYAASSLTEGRQRKLLQEVFGRYVNEDVARELLEFGDIPLGGNRQQITVMFTDLRNYTSYSEGRDPHQLVEELNEYFGGMSAEVKAHGGMINKFIGDGIMAIWGAPVEHVDDARRAVACGLGMVERNRIMNERRATQQQEPLRVGIGVHTGIVMVGHIGAPEKMEYTAMGDTVNRAARIESENKGFGTQLLISETTYHLVADMITAKCVGKADMKGVAESVTLYEVTGLR